jgi:hypothetical protein
MDAPQIFTGWIGGRKVSEGGDAGAVGVVREGRSASEANVRQAMKFWPREMPSSFEVLDNGLWRSTASDLLYEPLLSDPLFTVGSHGVRADDVCSCFVATPGGIVFLRSLNETQQSREKADEQRRLAAVKEREALNKRKLKEPLTPIMGSEVYGNSFERTLRAAAAHVLDNGGRISQGEFGELVIEVPERVTFEPLSEASARRELARSAEVLVAGHRVVLHALASGDEKLRLDHRLPDKCVSAGGGVG